MADTSPRVDDKAGRPATVETLQIPPGAAHGAASLRPKHEPVRNRQKDTMPTST
jgi:hypothetical protein